MSNKTIGYYLVKNETGNGSGYFIRVVPNGVVYFSEVIESVLEKLSTTENRCDMIWKEAIKVALKHALRGEIVDLGGIRIKAYIDGSSPCEDSSFSEGSGSMIVFSYVDDELRGIFADTIPYRLNLDDISTKTKVSNIMDVASEAFGTIDGTNEFVILGNNLTLDAEGEYSRLADEKTLELVANVKIIRVSKGQRAYCELIPGSETVKAGKYVLEIASKGLIGSTTPEIFRKSVTLISDLEPLVTPTVTKLYSDDRTDDKVAVRPQKLVVVGTGLDGLTKNAVEFKCMDDVMTIPASATWTFESNRIVVEYSDGTMDTQGTSGDDFSVTITKSGCDPVTFTTELA